METEQNGQQGRGQPTKEQVREWLRQRQSRPGPPPDSEQIRRVLGWKLQQGQLKVY